MRQHPTTAKYFKWLCDHIRKNHGKDYISFNKLLGRLHDIEFIYLITMDENRAESGMDLRWRFAYENRLSTVPSCLDGPCSVLEMMVALAIDCESIMDDTRYGDRTGQWFWGMIANLGLGSMTDNNFDPEYVDEVVDRFLYREYEYNGKGGLFKIRNPDQDLREVEIWHQLCWYLNSIT